jgi:hypothetical protein
MQAADRRRSLLDLLGSVPDLRGGQGRRYPIGFPACGSHSTCHERGVFPAGHVALGQGPRAVPGRSSALSPPARPCP